MTRKITLLDKTFWITESKDNTKHVASLQILEMPENATPDYLQNLLAEARKFDQAVEPLNCKVKSIWRWPTKLVPVEKLDMDYHVRAHQIDDVTDRKALHNKVAELHDEQLDRAHPLWQYHVLYDGKSRQFAAYLKIHHLYGDGATLVRWFQTGYLAEPSSESFIPVWAKQRQPRPKVKISRWKVVLGFLWEALNIAKDMVFVTWRLLLKMLRINTYYMPIPFTGTKTHLTGQVKAGRAVSTVEVDFSRVTALSHRARASANEIFLCAFDIAVHRFLQDYGQEFDKALFTNVPINLRKPGEQTSGNKIAIVPVKLAHGEKDPYVRLRQIISNHRIVKNAAQKARPASFSYYTILIQSFALIFEMLRISDYVRPIANILISNVPGPKETRYLRDSKLIACYPISTMTPGGGVNITLMSYAGVANVGMVCCNRKIASLEPLAEYFLESFEMLEKCIDDPTLSIDDIGERTSHKPLSIISEPEVEDHNPPTHI